MSANAGVGPDQVGAVRGAGRSFSNASMPNFISTLFPPQVLVSDPTKLEQIRERETDITKERIQKVLASGANVILTTKGIDDMSLKYFVEAGAIAVRRVPKDDLRCRIDQTSCRPRAVPTVACRLFWPLHR